MRDAREGSTRCFVLFYHDCAHAERPSSPYAGHVWAVKKNQKPRTRNRTYPDNDALQCPHLTTDTFSAPDLLEPHILRALADVQITSLHSSGASCHFVALARSGDAFVFGRNTSGALGVPPKAAASVSENAPRRVKASALPGGKAGEGIVHAACGRAHTLLVGSGGQVWAAGGNGVGQVRPLASLGCDTMC